MATDFVMSPVGSSKPSRAVAETLREAILTGALDDGESLPSERDLAGQADVSRGSVREGLRSLEAEGLIEVRSGRGGGAVVRAPGPKLLGRSFSAFIRAANIHDRPLVETLLVLEPAMAAIAADQRTDEDLARLTDLIDRFAASSDRAERLTLNSDWHIALGVATHNELLSAILNGLAQAVLAATDIDAFAGEDIGERAIASYRRIVRALEERDGEGAERAMTRHITAAADIARAIRDKQHQP